MTQARNTNLLKLICPAVVVVVVVPADGETVECCEGDADDCFGGPASLGVDDSSTISAE
jgi:hypothetical protein